MDRADMHRPDPGLSRLTLGHRPSWVPYWNDGYRVFWLGYPWLWYRSGGIGNFQVTISSYERSLRLPGVVFDTIRWTSQAFLRSESGVYQAPFLNVPELWNEISDRNLGSVYGYDGCDREDAFSLAIIAGRTPSYDRAEDDMNSHRERYKAYLLSLTEPENAPSPDVVNYRTLVGALNTNRRFFCTESGYYGIGPSMLREGDMCAVFRGANVPFVLRLVEGGVEGHFRLVGESYVQGVMMGEDGRNGG